MEVGESASQLQPVGLVAVHECKPVAGQDSSKDLCTADPEAAHPPPTAFPLVQATYTSQALAVAEL